jgi:hypothetical protein
MLRSLIVWSSRKPVRRLALRLSTIQMRLSKVRKWPHCAPRLHATIIPWSDPCNRHEPTRLGRSVVGHFNVSYKSGIDAQSNRRGSDRRNQDPFGTGTVSASMIEAGIAFVRATTFTNTASCAGVGRSGAV